MGDSIPVRVLSPRERASKPEILQPRGTLTQDAAPLEWIPSDAIPTKDFILVADN